MCSQFKPTRTWIPAAKTGQQKNNHAAIFFFFMKQKKMAVKYKRNSPVLVMRITSVSQLLTCTKAPSLATTPFDSYRPSRCLESTKFIT